MIRVTDILSKPVISLIDSKTEGIIKNAIFDKNFKKLKYLILFDNNEHLEEKALNITNIYSYGENAIIVKEESDLDLELSTKKIDDKPFPINNNVYTYLGKFIGIVNDIILDEKFNIISLIVSDKEIMLENIISSGLDAVIIQDEENKINIKSIKRKKTNNKKITDFKVENLDKVIVQNKQNFIKNSENSEEIPIFNNNFTNLNEEINEFTIKTNSIDNNSITSNENKNNEENIALSINNQAINEINTNQKTIKYKLTDNPSLPQVITTNYEFLIGRKIDKNIYSPSRELIARKNSKITNDTINKAKLYYKIIELTKYSRVS